MIAAGKDFAPPGKRFNTLDLEVGTMRRLAGALLLVLLCTTGALGATDTFSYGDVRITPLSGNIFRCEGTVTNQSDQFYQGACFNLFILDMNGKTLNTLMFCLDKVQPRSTRDFRLDVQHVNKDFQYRLEFLQTY